MKHYSKPVARGGFTLVITLMLMILLTVIAVGLLTLSSISLRSVGHSNAAAAAKANARLALMLALGDLQKTTGKDRAITAPASLIDETKPMGVTGVWEPWDAGSTGDSRTRSARDSKFTQWLVSSPDGETPVNRSAPPLGTTGATNTATLLGTGSLGERSSRKGDDQKISLETTPLASGKTKGRYAWVVIDESTKARADLHEKEPASRAAAVLRVGAPPEDRVSALTGLEKLRPNESEAGRMISMDSAGLVLGEDRDELKVYSPDVTVDATSLMTDVVSGGFKKDLSLWFDQGLTSSEQSSKLYASSDAVKGSYPSDPPLSLLQGYHDTYKKIGKAQGNVRPSADGIAAETPAGYTATNSGIASPNVPSSPLLTPTVLRVDIIFSLITRDVHGDRTANLKALGRPYLLHLLYLPVVTIHNPYNVPLSFESMKVTFKNVPISFQFLVNGQPVTRNRLTLNQLYDSTNNTLSKDFSCTLASSIGSTSSIVLKPGQTKLFGTPKVPPTWRWQDEGAGESGKDGVALFDFRNNQTADFQMTPKLMTQSSTIGSGFDIDWLSPVKYQTAIGNTCGQGEGVISLTGTETVGVNYSPAAPPAGNGNFNVLVELKQNGTFTEAGAFTIRYGDTTRLKSLLEKGTSVRFPETRSFPETYPKSPEDPPISANSIYENNTTAIRDYATPKPFVIFSVGSRTTKESFVPARTIADGNPTMNLTNIDFSNDRDPIGGAPLEMVMMPIRGGNAAIEEDRTPEEGYAFGGNGSLHGSPRATFYELPQAPLQSLAQFRHANLANSGFMPMTTYTVGESLAHPLIGTDRTSGKWTDNSDMLDHTWLSNEALWDRYFLSTIADQTTAGFDKAHSGNEVMEEFFAGTSPLPNQRFRPYAADMEIPAHIQDSSTRQDIIASALMLQGGFNVNSTSRDAWVAVLSGLRGADIETAAGTDAGESKSIPFPRVRRPTGTSIERSTINTSVTHWEGYRSLSDETIVSLAEEITAEVRERGPFLSLADFVNRGVGPDSEEINLKGAIQAAIDRTPSLNRVADMEGIDLAVSQVEADYGYKSAVAGAGNTATNAPGAITQGDVLTGLGSRITVRSDTFRIRAYGESRDLSGNKILARAWCEAIVQRIPDYLDPTDAATVRQDPDGLAEATTVNQVFGRRYQIISFRWLTPEEV